MTFIVGYFNTPLLVIDGTARQKKNQGYRRNEHHINQKGQIHTYRPLHPKTGECLSFSSTLGTFAKIDNMPGLRKNLKFKRTEIIQSVFLNTMKETTN